MIELGELAISTFGLDNVEKFTVGLSILIIIIVVIGLTTSGRK